MNHGNKQMKTGVTEAAWATSRTKNTFFSEIYHRIATRRGKKRALITVGHALLTAVYISYWVQVPPTRNWEIAMFLKDARLILPMNSENSDIREVRKEQPPKEETAEPDFHHKGLFYWNFPSSIMKLFSKAKQRKL